MDFCFLYYVFKRCHTLLAILLLSSAAVAERRQDLLKTNKYPTFWLRCIALDKHSRIAAMKVAVYVLLCCLAVVSAIADVEEVKLL